MAAPPLQRIDSMAALGRVVRQARRSQGVDQVAAAALSDVSPRWLGELERGKETLRMGMVLRVLERLGLEIWVGPRGAFRSLERPR
jgi:transcriptional regulator with XRE-family HTH domain